MRALIWLSTLLGALAWNSALAGGLPAGQPRGNLLELHSCEVYAGGCIVSSQATLEGRYLLRAWEFTGGEFAGTPLAGLTVAALQSSPENLAHPTAQPADTVVYLPSAATADQRAALLAWLKSSQADFQRTRVHLRIVSIRFAAGQNRIAFSAGDRVAVETAPLESCETGACGEALWYQPRSATSVFTVAVDRSSRVVEPLLQLKWEDAGKRSIFLGKFGVQGTKTYVAASDLCGPGGKLF